jgi:nuclear transport factor 2 (NTF2) superfamily protein
MKMFKHIILAAGFLTAALAGAQSSSNAQIEKKYPVPPFTLETALQKVQYAEDAWNSKDPVKISKAYTVDSEWRNRDKFVNGREEIVKFLSDKWKKELNYKLKKEYWAHTDNRIAVRFEYEYMDEKGNWFRAYGNENWEFDENGLMAKRYASINDLPIKDSDRKFK